MCKVHCFTRVLKKNSKEKWYDMLGALEGPYELVWQQKRTQVENVLLSTTNNFVLEEHLSFKQYCSAPE